MQSKKYDEILLEELLDTELAAEYLSAAAEGNSNAEFLIALRNVANAHGGVGVLAEITNLNRQSLYKMLSEDGNPTLESLIAVLRAVGISMSFVSSEKEAA